ncbi:hypothetical protein LEP1GSC032_0329 [Leptospira interrogans str. 2002000631]|uniref:Uncharacterized protein n=1 Tax=Leptospira interrogans serovar Hardjo str. Norma TaxID=1279460 RepID=A0A0M3TMU1_LEPIR|nr:hypothetical protein G436_4302 [Leptospira interrogans serovar Hardjo str. Norma]EMJ70244.1 hypothetical protein LEP1GSC033_1566 [Leptospira interrogans str. 2002000632]EMJ83757.1 hypothetical protein LEP1GSC032_0329 [Leptospira interrogans str. 2002000631]
MRVSVGITPNFLPESLRTKGKWKSFLCKGFSEKLMKRI